MHYRAFMSGLALALLLSATSPEVQRIEDPVRGYAFVLPQQFVMLPGFEPPAATARTGTLGTWVSGLGQEDFVIVSIEGMGAPLARERVDLTDQGRTGGTPLREKWKGFELDGLRMIKQREDQHILILAVQVPLSPDALQVMSSGLVENEAEVRAALRGVLASLEGKSNWLTDEERMAAGLEGALRLAVTFVLVAAAAFAVWRWARGKQQE